MPGATKIEELTDAPGKGSQVTIFDPEGFPVNLVFGQETAETGKLPKKLVYNWEQDKPREGAFQRFSTGPSAVHKVSSSGQIPCRPILKIPAAWALWPLRRQHGDTSSVLYTQLQPRTIRLPPYPTSNPQITRGQTRGWLFRSY